jgi:hypothetical protein
VKCMQDVRLARSERASWPVVVRDTELVWVPGVCRSDGAIPGDRGVRLAFSRRA